MRRLAVFNNISLDGFFVDANGDMSWAHQGNDAEFREFTESNAKPGGELLFGRITYELMAGYWPSPHAAQNNPLVAKQMNAMTKYVFSRTLEKAAWNNAKLIKGDLVTGVRALKSSPGPDMVIFGSGTIISQLAQENLIDEYQFVLNPIALGKGRTMFDGLNKKLPLKLIRTQSFKNGKVFLCYEPIE